MAGQQILTGSFLLLCVLTSGGLGGSESTEEANSSLEMTEGECERGRERMDGECPTWTWTDSNNVNCCNLGRTINSVVRWDSGNLSVLSGYCMTYDSLSSAVHLARCPYGRNIVNMFRVYHHLPPNKSSLNSAMCDRFHRRGNLCAECKPGYGSAVFSDDVNCYSCSKPYHGWALYLAFEVAPVTVMFIGLMLTQCRGSQGSINCFLFLAQVISYTYHFSYPEGSFPFGESSEIVIRVYHVAYGVFNFDFFRKLVPPFCVSDQLSGLQAISLLYTSMLYLILLIVLAYVLIELYAHDYRLLVWLWRPFNKYYKGIRRHVNPKTTLIDAFSTSLLLSFSRLLYISLILLRPTPLYGPQGSTGKLVLFQEGSIELLSQAHLPYVVLSVSVMMVFNVTPILFLFAYPTTAFQRFVGRPAFGKVRCMIHAFADTFQGCYKNGTNGTRDFRYFSGLYLLLRIVVCVGPLLPFFASQWITSGLLFLIMALLFANLRPYRCDVYNTMDSVWFTLASIFAMTQVIIASKGVERSKPYQIISHIILALPLVYIVCYIIYVSFLSGCKRRRRLRLVAVAPESPNSEEDLLYHCMDDAT